MRKETQKIFNRENCSEAKRKVIMHCINILEELGEEEVLHYKKEFPYEIDYNLAQYGNMLIYYYDIRQMFIECGMTKYADVCKQAGRKRQNGQRYGEYKVSDTELCDDYKKYVREAVRYFLMDEGYHLIG